jgi:hypothetical protein
MLELKSRSICIFDRTIIQSTKRSGNCVIRKIRNMNSQLTFEELIASSLTALDQISPEPALDPDCFKTTPQSQSKRSTLQSSGSIDDFLAEYRHEDATIVQFMSCLEGQELVPSATSESSFPESHARIFEESDRAKSDTSSYSGALASATVGTNSKTSAAVAQISLRVKMSPEKKAEMRRDKNREYQRRFREKKLRLDMQNTVPMGPTPYAAYPPFC